MFIWVYDYPTWQLGAGLAILFVSFSWVGTILLRPILRTFVRSRSGENDIVGYILSCFCVFYDILLGLLAVAAYQNYSSAELTVTKEAAALTALYRDVSAYPEPEGQNLRWLLRDYTRHVIKGDWPEQQKGIVPEGSSTRFTAFHEKLVAFEPQTRTHEIMHAETLRQFNSLSELRRLRLFAATSSLPTVMWYVVILGSIINIALVWLFDMRLITQMFLGGLLAFYLSAIITLIAAMDNPFLGEVSVPPSAYENVYKGLMMEGNGSSFQATQGD